MTRNSIKMNTGRLKCKKKYDKWQKVSTYVSLRGLRRLTWSILFAETSIPFSTDYCTSV